MRVHFRGKSTLSVCSIKLLIFNILIPTMIRFVTFLEYFTKTSLEFTFRLLAEIFGIGMLISVA